MESAKNQNFLVTKNVLEEILSYDANVRYTILAVYLYIRFGRMIFTNRNMIAFVDLYGMLGRKKNHASFCAVKEAIDIISENESLGIRAIKDKSNFSLNGFAQFEVDAVRGSFFRINVDDFNKLFFSTYKTKAQLISVYCIILSNIYERQRGSKKEKFPEAWSVSYLALSDMTGLSLATLVNIVKELQDLKLICCKVPDPERLGKDHFIRIPTIYARYGHEEELEYKYNQLASKFYKGCKKKSSKNKNVQNVSVTPGQSDGNSDDDWNDAWGTEAATDEWDDGYLE